MLKLNKIAITGGIASGKSTVCQLFRELGAYTINTDAVVHELFRIDSGLSQKLIRQFGPEIIKNEQIDREILADRVFKDPKKLEKLEEWVHPAVLEYIQGQYDSVSKRGEFSLFVVEIPLLYEIGAQDFYDAVIAVYSDEAKAKERFERAGFQKTGYDLRMKRQFSPEEKRKRADYIIYNNGSIDDLRAEVIRLNCMIHKQ